MTSLTSPYHGTLREFVVVRTDPDAGELRVAWRAGEDWRLSDPVPPFACTVTAFPDADALADRIAVLGEARDNAVSHTAHAPPHPFAPHVLLTVHFDRPVPEGASYDEAVTHAYAGRGTLSHAVEDGDGAWTTVVDPMDRLPTFQLAREAPGGFEVTWCSGDLSLWLDPDLEARLRALLDDAGVSLVGGGRLSKVFPGTQAEAVRGAAALERTLGDALDAIRFAAASRASARALMADKAIPPMLRRLSEGCVVLWIERYNGSKFSGHSPTSHQVRKGGGTPYRVSSEGLRELYRLGAIRPFWDPKGEHDFHGTPWLLMELTDEGRRLVAGDVAAGVARARRRCDMPTVAHKRHNIPFVEAVARFSATLTPAQREAIHGGYGFLKSMSVEAAMRASGSLETMHVVLIGLVSGRATLTPDGRLRLLPEPKPAKAGPSR